MLTPLNAKYAKAKQPVICFEDYQFGLGTAIQIYDRAERECVCTASVNVGGLESGHIAIKDYSENEGILAWLIENKIVSKPVRFVGSGYVEIPICKLLVDCKAGIE
jgi:hypothetical protein